MSDRLREAPWPSPSRVIQTYGACTGAAARPAKAVPVNTTATATGSHVGLVRLAIEGVTSEAAMPRKAEYDSIQPAECASMPASWNRVGTHVRAA